MRGSLEPVAGSLGLAGVMEALRYPRDELQTTRTLAIFAGSDAKFAREFPRLVLRVARSGTNATAARARAFPDLQGEFQCLRERHTSDHEGRCDLWFTTPGPPIVTLAIELKHGARYTYRQREKYLRELSRSEHGQSGLVVVTGRPQLRPPPVVQRNRRWFGEISWSALGDAGLTDLSFHDETLRIAWMAFCSALLTHGDLGALTEINVDRFDRWAAGSSGVSWRHAERLLTAVTEDCLQLLDRVLERRRLRARPIEATASGLLVRVPRGGSARDLDVSFNLSRGSEELQLNLAPTDDPEKDTRAVAEVWYLPRQTQKHLRSPQSPRIGGWRHSADYGGWYRSTRLEPSPSAGDLAAQLVAHWRKAVRALERLGVFQGITPAGPVAAADALTRHATRP